MPNSNNSSPSTSKSPAAGKSSSRPRRHAALPPTETLLQVLARLHVTDWDITIIGDGSGTGWAAGCGWAGVLVERTSRGRRLFYGGMNCGSINLAELLPYVHALSWYHAEHGPARLKTTSSGTLRVHVITDSQTIKTQGDQVSAGHRLPKSNAPMWAVIEQFQREGYVFTFHWLPRSTSVLNWCCDHLAGLSRRAIKAVELKDPDGLPISIYELNDY